MPDALQQTATPKTKVIAATGGAAVGASAAVIITWLLNLVLSHWNVTLPTEVSSALNVILTSASTFSAGYYVPPGASEGIVVAIDGGIRSAVTASPG